MKELFRDLLELPDVGSVTLFSPEGSVAFREGREPPPPGESAGEVLWLLTAALAGYKKADVAFRRGWLCLREPSAGLLAVVAGPEAPLPLVRLQMDLLLPSLLPRPKKRGLLGPFGGAPGSRGGR